MFSNYFVVIIPVKAAFKNRREVLLKARRHTVTQEYVEARHGAEGFLLVLFFEMR